MGGAYTTGANGDGGNPFSEGVVGYNPFARMASSGCIMCQPAAQQFVFVLIMAASLCLLWTLFED